MSHSSSQQNDENQDKIDFGYTQVLKQDKVKRVAEVFHSVADKYDVMNDLMSFGIHRIWKKITIEYSSVRKGQKVLDLAGGTGDLTAKFSQIVGDDGLVVLADINESMLKVGRDKLRDKGLFNNIEYVHTNFTLINLIIYFTITSNALFLVCRSFNLLLSFEYIYDFVKETNLLL